MHTEHVQTKREIESLLRAAGMYPRRRLGQHFLIDGNLMRRLVTAAELEPCDCVLEVGAGTGGLTDLLIRRVERVICVEIDRDLHAMLAERFRDPIRRGQITLLLGDVLESKHRLCRDLRLAIADCRLWVDQRSDQQSTSRSPQSATVSLVANLPYNIATPLVMNLLVDYPEVGGLVFTVQAEVGERITAKAGRKSYGPLSILAQTLCRVETVAQVPRQAFWPRPAVDSMMIRMEVKPAREKPFADGGELRRFAALVRGTFDHRRKTLRSALGYVTDETRRDRVCRRFDGTRRPESFNLDEWVEIFRIVDCGL